MIKVFIYIHSLHIGGGAENIMYGIATLLKKNCYEVAVCGMVDEYPDFAEKLKQSGITVYRLSINKFNLPGRLIKLFKIIRKEQPQIFMSWLWPAVITGDFIARMAGIKVRVANLRGPALYKSYFRVLLDRIFSSHYTHYLAVANSVRDIFAKREKFPVTKITVIGNGINLQKDLNIYDADFIRKEFKIAKDTFIIGTVGRLYPEKNHFLLIKVAEILKANNLKFKMILVGSGPSENKLKEQVNKEGLIDYFVFAGWQEDIYKFLTGYDLFVLPSKYEGHPSSILQAWLAKKPVIAAKVTGINDVIVDGKNGLLFSIDDPAEMASQIINLQKLENYRKELASNGYQTLRDKYDINKVNARYLEYFKNLCKS